MEPPAGRAPASQRYKGCTSLSTLKRRNGFGEKPDQSGLDRVLRRSNPDLTAPRSGGRRWTCTSTTRRSGGGGGISSVCCYYIRRPKLAAARRVALRSPVGETGELLLFDAAEKLVGETGFAPARASAHEFLRLACIRSTTHRKIGAAGATCTPTRRCGAAVFKTARSTVPRTAA